MRSVWLLLKLQFRSRFNLKDLTTVRSDSKGATWKRIGVLALFALLAVYAIGFYSVILNFLLNAGIDFGYPELVMDMAVLLAMSMTAVFGVFVTMSGIFLSRDTQLLAALPIPGRHVFAAKFLFVYLCETAISALFLFPAIILYAIKVSGACSVWFFVRGLYVTLLSPILPLVASTLLVSILMWVIGRLRHRDLFISIGSFVILFGVTIGQFYLSSKLNVAFSAEDIFADFFNTNWTTMNAMVQPPFSWASFAIHAGGMSSALNLILFTIVSIVAYGLVRLVSGGIYRHAVSVNLEAPKQTSFASKRLAASAVSPLRALLRKEFRVFFRVPVYLTNGLAGMIFPLLLFVFPLFNSETTDLLRTLTDAVPMPINILILAGFSSLMAGFGSAASTVLSREGKAIDYLRSLPLEARDLAKAKLLFSVTFSPLWVIPVCLFAALVLKLSIGTVLLGFVLSMLGSTMFSVICAWVDMLRPKFQWDTESEAIKQNPNVMLTMLIALAVLICLGAGTYFLLAYTEISAWVIFGAVTVIFAVGTVLAVYAALKAGERTYNRLD